MDYPTVTKQLNEVAALFRQKGLGLDQEEARLREVAELERNGIITSETAMLVRRTAKFNRDAKNAVCVVTCPK